MGAGASSSASPSSPAVRKQSQIHVPTVLKGYPQPEPPKFLLPDNTKNHLLPQGAGMSSLDVGYDWSEIENIAKEDKRKKFVRNDTLAQVKKNDPSEEAEYKEIKNPKFSDKSEKPHTTNITTNVANGNVRVADTNIGGQTPGGQTPGRQTQGRQTQGRPNTSQTSTYHQKNNAHISFTMIDSHARAATYEHSQTFSDLVTYLRQGITNKHYPELFLTRGLLIWLGNRSLVKLRTGSPDTSSPDGLLHHLKQGTLGLTGAFTLLCRAAKVVCVLVSGYVKVGDYEPGDVLEEKHEDTWCSVRVDHNWQVIHPVLACRGVYQAGPSGTVLIERDIGRVKIDKSSFVFNEEFFMPKPEDFIHRCYAHDIQWHLLPIQRTLKSPEDFQQLSYLSVTYFRLGLKLQSVPHCVQHSIDGVWMMELMAPKQYANRIRFAYQLLPEDVSDKTHPLLKPKIIKRLVLAYRNNEYFNYEVRLPTEGVYSFELRGGFDTLYNIMKVRVICGKALRGCGPLPVDTGSLGFGPGPAIEDVGLLLPSRPSGVISILPTYSEKPISPLVAQTDETITLTFQYAHQCLERFAYSAELLQSVDGQQSQDSKKDMSGTVRALAGSLIFEPDVKAKQLDLKVTVPADGEYALVIQSAEVVKKGKKKTVDSKSIKIVCYYLLTTISFRDPTGQRLARTELAQAMDINDPTQIRRALAKCDKFKIPVTDDDISAAKNRLEYLMLRHDMSEAIRRRNIPTINEVFRRVVQYKYRNCLVTEVKGLRKVREELLSLDGHTQPTPSVRDAVEELYKTSNPLPETHNTLIALGLLLGFDESDLKFWSFMHSQLRITTESAVEMNILRRIEFMEGPSFPWLQLDRDCLALTASVLSKYTYHQVARVSLPAAAFYKWVQQMLAAAEAKFDERNKREQEKITYKKNKKSKKQISDSVLD